MTPRMPNQRAEHHLVTVWNPAHAVDAMEHHLSLLLQLAGQYDKGAITDEELYVWWGKVRSPNRQGPQAARDFPRVRIGDVRRLGVKALEQAAGLLRVCAGAYARRDGSPPERYTLVEQIVGDLDVPLGTLVSRWSGHQGNLGDRGLQMVDVGSTLHSRHHDLSNRHRRQSRSDRRQL